MISKGGVIFDVKIKIAHLLSKFAKKILPIICINSTIKMAHIGKSNHAKTSSNRKMVGQTCAILFAQSHISSETGYASRACIGRQI